MVGWISGGAVKWGAGDVIKYLKRRIKKDDQQKLKDVELQTGVETKILKGGSCCVKKWLS